MMKKHASALTLTLLSFFPSTAAGSQEGGPAKEDAGVPSCEVAGTCKMQYGVTASTFTNCLATEQDPNRPRYTEKDFVRLRNVYRKVQLRHEETMNPIQPETPDIGGIQVPFEVKTVPGTSYRGVFATAPVAMGSKVWDSSYFGGFFTEEAWLDFLNALVEEHGGEEGENGMGKRMACDALQWSYVQDAAWYDVEEDEYDYEGGFMVVLDLDEGSFVNHGWLAKGEATVVDYDKQLFGETDSYCEMCMYALGDLQPGDQIVADYSQFYKFGVIEWYEASVAKAWDVDRSLRMSGQATEPQWHYR